LAVPELQPASVIDGVATTQQPFSVPIKPDLPTLDKNQAFSDETKAAPSLSTQQQQPSDPPANKADEMPTTEQEYV